MAFDFPGSPASGDVYSAPNGAAYQWDGEKWKGGQPSGPQTEQFFDLSGLSQIDIAVPSWAKGVEIESLIFVGVNDFPLFRLSFDGTTFAAGATDYNNSAPVHSSGGAAAAYSTTAEANSGAMFISPGGDSTTAPIHTTTVLNLTRPTATQLFMTRSHSRSFVVASGQRVKTSWYNSYYSGANTALAIKAFRLNLNSGNAFSAGSWLRVKWHGDYAQVPISNAIPDAPMDGKPWVRRNGLWVKQTGVVQQKVFLDLTDFSRAATTEAVMSVAQTFQPLYPDSKVIWEWAGYCTLTTTAAVDDIRGRLYGKFSDGSAYAGNIGQIINGHVNGASGSSQVFYGSWTSSPIDVSACRIAAAGPQQGQIIIRLYGMADYASVTLDSYDCTMRFTEFLE